jgi:glycosyltransferase involved in cell wall biosynthesis
MIQAQRTTVNDRVPVPLVSIVTPAYNQGRYLRETIESVLRQDYPSVEYIVIDDGSTDETPSILKEYSQKLTGISRANKGQARTLNEGWALAQGKYIGYLSSDDLLYPGALESLIKQLESDPAIVCAYPDCDLIDEFSRVIKKSTCRPFDLEDLVILQECHIGPGALFRRDAFETIGGWKPELRLAPDREFWIRLASRGRIVFHEEILAGYRLHTSSISYKDVSEAVGREYILVLDQFYDQANVSAELVARKEEAYGRATLILARNCFRAAEFHRGLQLYREACALHPPLASAQVKAQLVRNVVSKPIRMGLSQLRSWLR